MIFDGHKIRQRLWAFSIKQEVFFKMEAIATPFSSTTRIEQVCKVFSLAPQVADVLGA